MDQIRNSALIALAAALCGCAVIQPVINGNTQPEAASGYVTGSFTRVASGGFAFILRNTESGAEFAIPLGEDTTWPKDVQDQVVAIKVPPGRYAVSQWITYATLTKERVSKGEVSNKYLAAPFDVAAGSVTYLGNYSVNTTRTSSMIHWSVKPQPVTLKNAREAFLKTYPRFGSNAFDCRLCLDTLAARASQPAGSAPTK